MHTSMELLGSCKKNEIDYNCCTAKTKVLASSTPNSIIASLIFRTILNKVINEAIQAQ